ncbi:MAG: ROK family protein [Bacteroidales bacterium]|nr:ROK family protein [Bacteroidales bacterium]
MEKYVIGVDIGGTNTDIGIVSDAGKCLARRRISTQAFIDAELYADSLAETINALIAERQPCVVSGVGIGAPNAHFYSGTIDNAPNLPFKGKIYLKKMLEERLGLPVVLTNDANAAAYGELVYGGGRGMSDFIMLTLGTGVGSGIVSGGKVVYGHDGFAGELGHVITFPGGRLCSCGRRGCLEEYASVRGIIQNFWELAEKTGFKSPLLEVKKSEIDCIMIGNAAEAGDALAKATVEYTGSVLGLALANVVAITSPKAIFIMGGPSKLPELLPAIRKSMEDNLLSSYKGKVEVRFSELDGNDVAILGAAAMVLAENV